MSEAITHLTVELWRPAPDQTIKTDSPTQGDTQEKVPLLGSPTNDLLYCPNLTTVFYEWKTNALSTGHGAVVADKVNLAFAQFVGITDLN